MKNNVQKDVEKLLSGLISTPSVNPAVAPSAEFAEKFGGEKRICEHIWKILSVKDFQKKIVFTENGRPSLIVKLPGTGKISGKKKCVAFFAHADTVWTQAMENPFKGRIEKGTLYGLGACDNKASLCVGILTLLELSKVKSRNFDFVFAATADEESGFTGIRSVCPSHVRPDFAIVGEPTGLDIATAHKGVCRWKVETFGKSVHASLVPQGKNAIYDAVILIGLIKRHLEEELLKEPAHHLLGRKTLNIGRIEGGTQPNSVPDKCNFIVERRLLPGETEKMARERIEKIFRKSRIKYRISLNFLASPYEISEKNQFVEKFCDSAIKIRKGARICGLSCATEASLLGEYNIPAVVFGAGMLKNAHSAGEMVKICDIIKARDIVISYVLDYLNR